VLLGVYAGYKIADNAWQSKWDKAEAAAATNQLEQVNSDVELYNKRIAQLEVSLNETKQKLATAYLDAAAAATSGDSLQQSFADSLRESNSCADSTTSVRELAAAATDATVQAYVFSSIVKEAVGYAGIAEEAIVRGEGCQADYNTIRSKHEK
jgi:hypothetical protein